MKFPFRLITSLVALLSCGCSELEFEYATFANPTVEPEEAEVQMALCGSYIESEPSVPKGIDGDISGPEDEVSLVSMYHVGKAGDGFPDGFHRAAFVEIESDGTMDVDDLGNVFLATKIDDFYVLNFPLPKVTDEDLDSIDKPPEKVVEWKPENYEGYFLVVLRPTQTGFKAYFLDKEKLKAEIKAGRLSGDYMTKEEKDEHRKKEKLAKKEGKKIEDAWRPFTVKASPRELRAFIEKRVEDVIDHEPFLLFKRAK